MLKASFIETGVKILLFSLMLIEKLIELKAWCKFTTGNKSLSHRNNITSIKIINVKDLDSHIVVGRFPICPSVNHTSQCLHPLTWTWPGTRTHFSQQNEAKLMLWQFHASAWRRPGLPLALLGVPSCHLRSVVTLPCYRDHIKRVSEEATW